MAPRVLLASVIARVVGRDLPIAFEAYDGSRAGPSDAGTTLRVVDPRALNYLATAPSSLGLARAYASGFLDVDGDIYEALRTLAGDGAPSMSWLERLDVLRQLGPSVLRPIAPPPE